MGVREFSWHITHPALLPACVRTLLIERHPERLRLRPCACLSKMATSKALPADDDKRLQEVLDLNRCTLASGKEGCVLVHMLPYALEPEHACQDLSSAACCFLSIKSTWHGHRAGLEQVGQSQAAAAWLKPSLETDQGTDQVSDTELTALSYD